MIHDMLTIVLTMTESPLVRFFGLFLIIFAATYGVARALHLQENFS